MTDVCQIPLTRGKVALIDAADFECVAAHEWCAACTNGRWYAVREVWSPKRSVIMHRFILGIPPRVHVGFVNGDSLDCRRGNLQMRKGKGYYLSAPQGDHYPRESLPMIEAKVSARRRGRYVGVVDTESGKFRAQIKDRGKSRWLGTYATERDAAFAFNVAARLLRGQDDRCKSSANVNDVPPAVPLDELERAARALAGEPEIKQSTTKETDDAYQ